MLTFANLNDNQRLAFETEENYNGFVKLSYDLAFNNELVNEDGNAINKSVAEKVHLTYVRKLLNINENSTKRDRKRAFKKHGMELFEVIEDVIDIKVEEGFKDNEFFNEFVESKNIKRGDRNEFWTDEKVYLSVVEVAGDHHDFNCRVRIA